MDDGLEVRRAHGLAEVVEVLQGQEAKRSSRVPPEGHDDEGGHHHEGQGRPGVAPGGVEEGEGEAEARRHEHRVDGHQDDPGPLLRPSGR